LRKRSKRGKNRLFKKMENREGGQNNSVEKEDWNRKNEKGIELHRGGKQKKTVSPRKGELKREKVGGR